jgi:hypothetical protein
VTATFPEAAQIAGLYHAREHMHSLVKSLEFMLLDHMGEWLAARMEDLDYGDIDGIETAVREFPLEGTKKQETEKELGYFLNNAPLRGGDLRVSVGACLGHRGVAVGFGVAGALPGRVGEILGGGQVLAHLLGGGVRLGTELVGLGSADCLHLGLGGGRVGQHVDPVP